MSRVMWDCANKVERSFVGYKPKQTSVHLTSVTATGKRLVSYKSFLGIKYDKHYEFYENKIPFIEGFLYSPPYQIKECMIYVAIDEDAKVVYWHVCDYKG